MPERISSVYDIPDWLAENFPSLTGPTRTAWNAAMLPNAVAADVGRSAVHGALGLEEAEPYRYSGERMNKLVGALGDTTAPARKIMAKGSEGVGDAMQATRELLMEAGARPAASTAAPTRMRQAPEDYRFDMGMPAAVPAQAPQQRRPQRMAGGPGMGAPGPQGALDTGAGYDFGMTGNEGMPATGALAGPAVAASRPGMAEMFRQRINAIEKASGQDLTDQQKKQLQLDFFLRLSEMGAKRGSTLLGSVGAGGLQTSALARQMQERNRTDASGRRREAREDAFRELSFEDKDQDNIRADKREERTGKREDARIDLLRRQVEQGKWKVMDNGKTGTYVLFDQETGQTKDTGIKVPQKERKDTRPAEIQLLEHLNKHPEDFDILSKLRASKDKNDTDQIFEAATRRLVEDSKYGGGTSRPSVDEVVRDAQRAMTLARGGQVSDDIARPKTEAEVKALPKGARFVNPSDGKAYTKN